MPDPTPVLPRETSPVNLGNNDTTRVIRRQNVVVATCDAGTYLATTYSGLIHCGRYPREVQLVRGVWPDGDPRNNRQEAA